LGAKLAFFRSRETRDDNLRLINSDQTDKCSESCGAILMRRVVCWLAVCVLGGIGTATSQNRAVSDRNRQSSCAHEPLSNSDQERLQWEAAETWSQPAIPNLDQPNIHPIHIDLDKQPSLTLPKLRREWLEPSAEAAAPESTADLQRLDERAMEYFARQTKPNK
jgi:hypothetical protein